MFDARGLKADAIKESIIRNDMISANANIDGSKLNIISVVSGINEGVTTLKASKVQIDGVAQTLEVAFNVLKTQADGTKSQTESNTTAINVAQGKINTLIQDTTITKDGQSVKLKDEYSKLEQIVGSLSSTIGKQQTTINDHTGKIIAFNSEIVSLKQNMNGLSLSVSTAETIIQSHTQQLAQKANTTDVDAKINSIQIGGRNYILSSDKYLESMKPTNVQVGRLSNTEDVRGKAITVSLDIDVEGMSNSSDSTYQRVGYEMSIYYTDGAVWHVGVWHYVTEGDFKGRKTRIYSLLPDKEVRSIGYSGLYIQCNATKCKIGRPKIEIGNKATDWSPAPEDIASALSTKANSTDVYKKTETYTKSETDSKIKVAKDEINLGVSQTYETKSNVESKISTAVSNIQIGGRNLLRNSNFAKTEEKTEGTNKHPNIYPVDWGGYNSGLSFAANVYHAHVDTNTFGFNVVEYNESDGTRHWKGIYQLVNKTVKQFDEYVLSLDAYATMSGTKLFGGFYYYKKGTQSQSFASGQFTIDSASITVGQWGRVSVKVPLNDDVDFSKSVAFYIYGYGFSTNAILYIKNVQLETGNKSTSYTVSPEDTEEDINGKANKTDVYTKSETYTKAQTDSAIKVAKDAINLAISSTYETKVDVTAKINGVNSSISALQQRVSTAESKITDSAITNLVKQNFYTKEETNTQITSKGYQTASQVQQLVDQVAYNFNQSGGYNLLLNSRWEYDWFGWNTPDSSIIRIQDATTGLYYCRAAMVLGVNRGLTQSFKQEKGRTYTVSAQVDIEAGAIAGIEISYTNASGTKLWIGVNTASNPSNYKNGILSFTWTTDVSGDVQVNFYSRGAHGSGVTAGKYLRWRYTQVEQGRTHTGWSPNPYEIYQGQTLINKNGVRVNASNVGTYSEMTASGFFVKYNNGNKLFEASNCIKLYDNNNVSAIEVLINPSAAYGNAMINVRGGINFLHKPGQSTGTNGIQLGNHDISNQYGMHNLSIRCWNSLGFSDNNNSTNMFADVRRGRWIMKGALYQNTATPPATFSMNFDGEDEIYNSGYERSQAIDSVMNLKTGVYVDNEGECCSAIYGGYSELLTTEYMDEDGYVTTHLNHEALNASLVVTCQEQQKLINALQKELNEIKEYLNVA